MSTENIHPQDESSTASASEAAQTEQPAVSTPDVAATQDKEQPVADSAPASTPAESQGEPESPADPTPAAPASAAEVSEEGDRQEDDGSPRRKIRLQPTLPGEDIRPVANVNTGTPVLPASSGPVSIPSKDDAEVEAELASTFSAIASEQQASLDQPASEGGPVELPSNEAIAASVEAAIEAAMTGTAESEAAKPVNLEELQPGHKLRGVVQAVSGDSVLLDFALPMTGVVPFRQFSTSKPPEVGQTIDVVFEQVNETEGLILTNLPRGTAKIKGGDWDAVSPDQIVECMVTKTNKGGLEVAIGSLRGFLPASQVEMGYVSDLETYVGQKIRVKITEVKPSKRRLVVSRRAILAEEREVAKAELLNEIKPDQVRTGRVKTIKEYGAFVDLGGMDGFLPIAQMSWVRIGHPSEVLNEGDEIEVKVLSIDQEKNRISLGMRQLAPNPWRAAESKYAKGSVVTGRVTRLEAFGAFVELEPGVEGLIHISELEHRRVKQVSEVLKVDDMTEVQVLEVDPKRKRISLSAKALKVKPEPVEKPKDEDLAPGKGESYQRKRSTDHLKGGTGLNQGGGLFGNPKDFNR